MTPTEPILCRYVWDATGLVQSWKAHRWISMRGVNTWSLWVLLAVISAPMMFLVVAIPAGLILGRGLPPVRILVSLVVIMLLFKAMWATCYFLLIKQAHLRPMADRHFRSIPGGSSFVEWAFEADRVVNQTELMGQTLAWGYFVRVVETPGGFLLYEGSSAFRWLPAHGFRSEAEMNRFAALARSRIVHYIAFGSCRFVGKPRPIETDEF